MDSKKKGASKFLKLVKKKTSNDDNVLSMMHSTDKQDVDDGRLRSFKLNLPKPVVEKDEEEDMSFDEEEADDRLLQFADRLDDDKPDQMSSSSKPRRKVLTGGRENENRFSVGGALSLSDLLGESDTGKGALKRRLERVSSVIAPALPKTEQDRAERRVGYENASLKLDNWEAQVVSNRKNKLQFPLNEKSLVEKPSIANLIAKQARGSEMEREIAEALEASGLATEKQMLEAERQSMHALEDQGEAQKRHADLAKMRALMFYSEQKAKRIKKIKSKTFRKLRKKRLSREEEQALEKLREEDPEAAKEHDEKIALERAHERMSLRHKNTSKNMRELGKRHKYEDATHELKRKMGGIRNDSSSAEDSEEGEEDEADLARQHLQEVESDQIQQQQQDKGGLFEMEFMKRGMQKDRERALLQAREFAGEEDVDAAQQMSHQHFGKKAFGGSITRKSATKGTTTPSTPLFEKVDFSSEDEEQEEDVKPKVVKRKETVAPVPTSLEAEEEDNPWLASSSSSSKRSANKPTRESVVSVSKVLANIAQQQKDDDEEQDNEENRALVKRAFADVIAQDFEDERRNLVEQATEEMDTKVAGWGTWTGMGVSVNNKNKKRSRVVEQPIVDNGQPKNVILVNTRTNKLQKKYQVDQIPYPFTSREQYERSLTNPLNPEVNTANQFAKKVQPDVSVRVGAIVQPIKFQKVVPAGGSAGSMNAKTTKKMNMVHNRRKL